MLGRDRPRAAIVPKTVANAVAEVPMISECLAALTQVALAQVALAQTSAHQAALRGASGFYMPNVNNMSYQRKE